MPLGGPFDAATSLLVAHFIEDEPAKRGYFRSIAEQLAPGAPLVWADLYHPSDDDAGLAPPTQIYQHLLWGAWMTQLT